MNKERSTKWKDELIDRYMHPMAELLFAHLPSNFQKIKVTFLFHVGSQRTSAVYYDSSGKSRRVPDFFDIVDELEKQLISFHNGYVKRDENWVAMLLTISPDGDFDIQFEYTDPYKWDGE